MTTEGNQEHCAHCGKVLRYACRSEWADTDEYRPPSTCIGCKTDIHEPVPGGPWKLVPEEEEGAGVFECQSCHERSCGRRKRCLVRRTRLTALPGYGGDGLFCTLRCGYEFAVEAIRTQAMASLTPRRLHELRG